MQALHAFKQCAPVFNHRDFVLETATSSIAPAFSPPYREGFTVDPLTI